MFLWRYPCNTVVVRKTFSQKTNFYPPRMHLKRRFFLFKGDTRKSSWNPDIPRPLCVHSSPSYRAVALCEDCWWWLPPALSSPPCSACHTYSTKPTWYKSILNSQGIDEYLALPYLIMMFYTCQYASFFFKLNYMYMYLLHFITSTLSMEILS